MTGCTSISGKRSSIITSIRTGFWPAWAFKFTKTLNAQLGYMQVFQQQPAGNRFFDTHALRLFVFHNLDLRKPVDTP